MVNEESVGVQGCDRPLALFDVPTSFNYNSIRLLTILPLAETKVDVETFDIYNDRVEVFANRSEFYPAPRNNVKWKLHRLVPTACKNSDCNLGGKNILGGPNANIAKTFGLSIHTGLRIEAKVSLYGDW